MKNKSNGKKPYKEETVMNTEKEKEIIKSNELEVEKTDNKVLENEGDTQVNEGDTQVNEGDTQVNEGDTQVNEEVNEEVNEGVNEEVNEEDTKEEGPEETIIVGRIQNCKQLHLREKASTESASITIIDEKSELLINLSKSTENFYKVSVENLVGYCVKKFIKLD